MGKHVFTLTLRAEIESQATNDGESGRVLAVPLGAIYETISSLRNDLFSDLEVMQAAEFAENAAAATEINAVLAEIEKLDAAFSSDLDDDEDEDAEGDEDFEEAEEIEENEDAIPVPPPGARLILIKEVVNEEEILEEDLLALDPAPPYHR